MFESIRKKVNEQNKDNSTKDMSLDFKLMFVYHIAMMVLFGTRIVDNAAVQALFALVLFVVLVLISAVHKFRSQWKWPGLGILGLPSALFHIVVIYAFLAFAAYNMNPDFDFPNFQNSNYIDLISESWAVIITVASVPAMTPWYLVGVGFGVFNLLSSLKLATTKKSEFESQCINS